MCQGWWIVLRGQAHFLPSSLFGNLAVVSVSYVKRCSLFAQVLKFVGTPGNDILVDIARKLYNTKNMQGLGNFNP